MASSTTACVLYHHGLSTLSRSCSTSQRPQLNIKPSKLVCRAQSKPQSNGTAGDGGVSRRSILENLVVASAAVGSSALAAFVSPAAYAGSDSSKEDKEFSLYPPGKLSWPELVGEKGEVAVATIKKENPKMKPIVVSENSPVILNFVSNRVWVVVDEKGVVTQVPKAG